jgi:hypothetical protein
MPTDYRMKPTPEQRKWLETCLAVKLLTLDKVDMAEVIEKPIRPAEVPLFAVKERLYNQDHLFKIAYEICGDFRMTRQSRESLLLVFNDLSLLIIDHQTSKPEVKVGIVPPEDVEMMKASTTSFLDYIDIKRVMAEILPQVEYLYQNHDNKSARTVMAGLFAAVLGEQEGRHVSAAELATYYLAQGDESWPCLDCMKKTDSELRQIYDDFAMFTPTATSAKH